VCVNTILYALLFHTVLTRLSETGFSVCSPQSGNETYQKLALPVKTSRALDR
jgi:hypothetical protein